MSYGFTAYEVEALKPHVVLVREKRPDYSKLGGIVLLVAIALFVLLYTIISIPTESYAASISISNHDWCKQTLKDHGASGLPIQSEIVKMCAKELGV